MSDDEIEVLEFVHNSKHEIYHKDIPFFLCDLLRLHELGYIWSFSDKGYDMGCDVDTYRLTEKGQSAVEEHYLERRMKGLQS